MCVCVTLLSYVGCDLPWVVLLRNSGGGSLAPNGCRRRKIRLMKALPGLPQAAADCMHQICEMNEGLSLICPIAICHRVPHNWGTCTWHHDAKFGLHDCRILCFRRALIDWISEPLGSIVCPGCVANPHQACHRPVKGWAAPTLHTSNETHYL